MFQKGLALKQKKIQNDQKPLPDPTVSHTESTNSTTKKNNQARSVTLSSVLLAKRFSSTLLAPINRNNVAVASLNNTNETTIATKKQHNPRRHVFAMNIAAVTTANENENPAQSSGEKVKI
jgi:hypothetical protein